QHDRRAGRAASLTERRAPFRTLCRWLRSVLHVALLREHLLLYQDAKLSPPHEVALTKHLRDRKLPAEIDAASDHARNRPTTGLAFSSSIPTTISSPRAASCGIA